MRPLHLIIILLGIYSCHSAWECNKGSVGESGATSTVGPDCNLAEAKQVKCSCKVQQPRHTYKPWCYAIGYLIERARFSTTDTAGKSIRVKFGVQQSPTGFTDPLKSYADWNNAPNNKSRYFLEDIRHVICLTKLQDNGDYIYDKSYEPKEENKDFNPVAGKNIIHFQLTFECSYSKTSEPQPGNIFRVYFNKFLEVDVGNDTVYGMLKPHCKAQFSWPLPMTRPHKVCKNWTEAEY